MAETTWILSADSRRVRVFEAAGILGTDWHEIVCLNNILEKAARARGNRGFKGAIRGASGSGYLGSKPALSPARRAAGQFARMVADFLEGARRNKRFGKLVLVATPRFLGELRRELGAPERARVVKEVPRESVQCTPRSLQRLVTGTA